ncbi:uncharacterized protein [Engystomops pustulosus]|uniref:uncharacterized protein n=1 Tax=Engystomops pustulosus TaxID=76066 RepID=UPI003AFA83D4
MQHSTVQMGKKKNSFKKVLSKLKNIRVSHPENNPLLPNKGQPKENTHLKKIKERLTFEVPITNYVKLKNKVKLVSEPQENCKSKEEQFKSLMDTNKYYNACLLIHDVEQNGKLDGSELYEVVAQDMWRSLTLALDGDPNQTVNLQSISQCITWARQQNCNKDPEWSPHEWGKELENVFENDMKKHSPKFELDKGVGQYLLELEKNITEIILRLEQYPEVLAVTYMKCLHVDLFDQLKCLIDKNQKFEDHVLLFQWAHKEHRRLCKYQVGSEDFDHMLFGNWFLDSGNKIASTGREAMYRTLLEILQSEIVWNSYPKEEVRYYFTDVLEEGTKFCKTVEDLGFTLVSRLQSLFLEEFLHFLTRYKVFLTEKLGGVISGNGICVGIRILKNCSILRHTINDFHGALKDLQIQEIQSILWQCENKGIDLVLSSMKPSLKEAFKNYFKKNCNQYENVLRNLKCALINVDIQNEPKLVTLLHHRLVVLFIQSFFKCSKKLSGQNTGEIFSKGSKKLLEFFSDMISTEYLLPSSPLNFISDILTTKDSKSLHTTTVFFIKEHQDLREEHLKALLNIRGNLSSNEKEDILYYKRNSEISCDQNKLGFFEDIHVDKSKMKYFLCCLD